MTILPVEREDFYSAVVSMVNASTRSVYFYSISCCFGFYSEGLSTFEKICDALEHSLGRKVGKEYVDVRVLVKIDRENPIDAFAAARLNQLGNIRPPGISDRSVFRALDLKSEQLQFLIVDDEQILITEIQEEYFNSRLGIVLNRLKRGNRYSKSDNGEEFFRHSQAFYSTWDNSSPLHMVINPVSLTVLMFFLKKYKEFARGAESQRELHASTHGYLRGLLSNATFGDADVELEQASERNRIDVYVGRGSNYARRYGIETKLGPRDEDINPLVGQLRRSRKDYNGGLALVVVNPVYSEQGKRDLLLELSEVDIGYIEL